MKTDNTSFYIFSLFYARENWIDLIDQVNQYRWANQDKFSNCLFFLSEIKGEQVEVILVSMQNQVDLKQEIDDYFQEFLKKHASIINKSFPYGKALWCNYPNNSILWKRYKEALDFSDRGLHFHQKSFRLALHLIESDISGDTLFSAVLYMTAKVLTCIDKKDLKAILSAALHEVNTDPDNTGHIRYIQSLIEKQIDSQEMNATIDLYLNEEMSENSNELNEWLVDVREMLDSSYSFSRLARSVCRMLGFNGLYQMMLMELLNAWYNTTQNANA